VVGLLDMETTTQSDQALRMKETDRAEAYFAYLEGRGYLHRFDIAGNIDRAIERLEKALKEDPRYVLAYAALGEAYWRKALATNDKAYADRAVDSARKAVQLGGSLAVPHVKLGEIYTQSGQQHEAIREFQLALASQPASADAYRGLGRAYSSIGLKQEAENAYLQAVRLRPNDWYAHNLLGVFYYGVGKYNEAEQAWIQARELTPDNEYPYRNLGMVYLATGKFDAARAQFQKSNAIKPSFLAHLGLGRLSYYADRPADAVAEYETAIKIEPNNHLGWGALGDAYRQMSGREKDANAAWVKAIMSCERRLALAPGEEEILAFLASYHAKSGQKARALEILARLADAPDLRPNTRFEIALTHETIGERRLAAKEFASLMNDDQRSATQIRSDPALRQLNRDPEFISLVRR
jgi:serine/threonine-protein kinase